MSQKPTLPKGTRDFGPQQMSKRNFIFNTIREVFEKYGFMPLETPAMENLNVLSGKYGEEGDQLIFKILNSGDFLKELKKNEPRKLFIHDFFKKIFTDLILKCVDRLNDNDRLYPNILEVFDENIYRIVLEKSTEVSNERDQLSRYLSDNKDKFVSELASFFSEIQIQIPDEDGLEKIDEKKLIHHIEQFHSNVTNKEIVPAYIIQYKFNTNYYNHYITEKGLKYDLTVPFARYVVMNQHELALPFKRYQIQPVWRADRPQRGRYREFFQCDADVVGTDSLICEAEIVLMINEVFTQLGITDFNIKINHRQILKGITEAIGAQGLENEFCVAIDKLDKIGLDKVLEEMKSRGISQESAEKSVPILQMDGSIEEKLLQLKGLFKSSEAGSEGLKDIEETLSILESFELENHHLDFDVALARGLSYYTGMIFEVKVNNVKIGSVSGGGRYDDLTGVFGLPNLSGIGFSFGVDRLYDVMEELDIFPKEALTYTEALIIHFDDASKKYGLSVLNKLRKANIKAEIFPETAKIKKQFGYADKKNIAYAIIIGPEELSSEKLTLRNMSSGIEEKLSAEGIIQKIIMPDE